MVNKVILVGRLGGDPEGAVGNRPLTFSMATSERWRDKTSGERREKTNWHSIVVFQRAAQEYAGQYLKKGAQVYVEGMMITRDWTGSDGVKRYSTEVVVKDFSHKVLGLDRAASSRPPAGTADDYGGYMPGEREDDDDLAGEQGALGMGPPAGYDPNARPRTTYDTA